jgi:hypothetical protein
LQRKRRGRRPGAKKGRGTFKDGECLPGREGRQAAGQGNGRSHAALSFAPWVARQRVGSLRLVGLGHPSTTPGPHPCRLDRPGVRQQRAGESVRLALGLCGRVRGRRSPFPSSPRVSRTPPLAKPTGPPSSRRPSASSRGTGWGRRQRGLTARHFLGRRRRPSRRSRACSQDELHLSPGRRRARSSRGCSSDSGEQRDQQPTRRRAHGQSRPRCARSHLLQGESRSLTNSRRPAACP